MKHQLEWMSLVLKPGAALCLGAVLGLGMGGCSSLSQVQKEEQVVQYSVDKTAPRCSGTGQQVADCVVLVSFTAQPWVDVFLDSQYVGRTPLTDVPVKPKKYEMRLVNPSLNLNYASQKAFEVPPEGERITLNFNVNP